MEGQINCLDYLKSKTQVDVDSLDIRVSIELGPFVDCTSNQADAYQELLNPRHADLLKKAAALANEIKGHYHSVNFEELAMELSMLSLATSIAPKITGAILVMVNPRYSYSTAKIIDNGQRLYRLCKFLEPDFDLSRLIIKVPSTWEGMQACRKLKNFNVKTLATTVFSMEQAILAAEAGCIYISPFLNELKATFDSSPIFDICVDAQRYYEHHSYPIRVKACAAVNVEQILQLAGVHAFTAPADQLRELASMQQPAAKLAQRSLFKQPLADANTNGNTHGQTNGQTNGHANGGTHEGTNGITNGDAEGVALGNEEGDTRGESGRSSEETLKKRTFIDDESEYRLAFSRADDGKAQMKLTQALNMFSDYQVKAEALMRDNDMTKIG
ncbi:MAG: hypothetical protein LQ346_006651 [Caloplaca aetnensis]|nr:MAG: hypothetical protein LQ346_006651 [Caloplaca aetnensis]